MLLLRLGSRGHINKHFSAPGARPTSAYGSHFFQDDLPRGRRTLPRPGLGSECGFIRITGRSFVTFNVTIVPVRKDATRTPLHQRHSGVRTSEVERTGIEPATPCLQS